MELTQEQVNHIVDIAETYQTELDDASARFRRRLIEAGLPMGPAGRLVERERYFRPLQSYTGKRIAITFDEPEIDRGP